MKTQNFGLIYFLLILGQMILCNFAGFTPYVMLSMLPAMVICIPLTVSTPMCMLIAFATGLSVDWLSEGLIGINAAALVPVALMRKPLIRFFLGEDLIVRSDNFSIRKNGVGKISLVLGVAILIFLGIYIFLDGAGTRPTWFNLTRTGASLVCNYLLALIVTNILTVDDRK
ncbi:MAG: hypothetical protein E7113_05340 [Bacteroidales bacterium]|nr:hypothetical protein [Bacteroidales bacterium]